MIDFCGHISYSIILIGIILLSHKKRVGWLVCTAGQLGWIITGIVINMTSIWTWSIVFALWNVYGYWNWKYRK